jgi:hypothetical protein
MSRNEDDVGATHIAMIVQSGNILDSLEVIEPCDTIETCVLMSSRYRLQISIACAGGHRNHGERWILVPRRRPTRPVDDQNIWATVYSVKRIHN